MSRPHPLMGGKRHRDGRTEMRHPHPTREYRSGYTQHPRPGRTRHASTIAANQTCTVRAAAAIRGIPRPSVAAFRPATDHNGPQRPSLTRRNCPKRQTYPVLYRLLPTQNFAAKLDRTTRVDTERRAWTRLFIAKLQDDTALCGTKRRNATCQGFSRRSGKPCLDVAANPVATRHGWPERRVYSPQCPAAVQPMPLLSGGPFHLGTPRSGKPCHPMLVAKRQARSCRDPAQRHTFTDWS